MQKKSGDRRYAIIIIGVLFFVFGFVTWLNGTLIPFLKLACELENDIQAFFVTFAFYMAYFFLAIPSSMILRKTGFKNGRTERKEIRKELFGMFPVSPWNPTPPLVIITKVYWSG